MDDKNTEAKMFRLITKVNDALNAQGKKISAKINDLMEEIRELKEDAENTRIALKEKCNCENIKVNISENKENLDKEIETLRIRSNNNKKEINEVTLKLKKLEADHIEFTVMHNVENQQINNEINQKMDPLPNNDSLQNPKKLECEECNERFSENIELKNHIIMNHQRKYNCESCEEKFSNSSQMETHLLNVHKMKKIHKCSKCDSSFLLQWRLKKHMKTHGQLQVRTCHYFNNNSECPFNEVGCKFKHSEAKVCKFGDECKVKLCQYRH